MRVHLQAVALYGVVNLLALALMILFILLWLFMKIFSLFYYCCKCCCFCCKNKDKDDGLVKDMDSYTKTDKYRIACFTAAILGITIVFTLSTVLGNYKISENSSGFADAPVGFQLVLQGMVTPVSNMLLSTASLVLAPMLLSVNSTFNQAISLPDIIEQLQVLNNSKPLYPSLEVLYGALYEVADATTIGAEPYFDALYENISGLDDQVTVSKGFVQLLQSDVDDVSDAIPPLQDAAADLNTTLYQFADVMVELVGSADGSVQGGLIKDANDALTAVQRQPDGLVPDTSEFDATVTGGSGTLPRLQDGSMENQVNEIEQLAVRLHWLYLNMSQLPDYSSVADDLDSLNATIADVLRVPGGMLYNMTSALSNLDTAIDGFPNLTSVSDHLTGLLDAVGAVDFTSIIDLLEALLDSLFEPTIRNVGVVYNETAKLKNVVGVVVPALRVLRAQVDSINATLVEIRSKSFEEQLADFDEKNNETWVNDYVDDVLDIIDEARDNITTYQLDSDEYLADARNFSDTILEAIDSFNFTSITNSLVDAQSFIDDADLNATTGATTAFSDALGAVSLSTELTNSLRSFQTVVNAMNALMARVAANETSDYYLLALGVCSNNALAPCNVDGDCGAGTCIFGKYRCKESGAACTEDSDCAGAEVCLADTGTASALQSYMTSFASTASDIDVSGVTSALELTESLNDVDLNLAIDSIDDVLTALDTFSLTDISDYLEEIDDATDINITETISDPLRDIQELMVDLNLRERIEKYDYSNFTWQRYLIQYVDTFTAIKDFMIDDKYLASAVRNLSTATLHGIRKTQGHSAAVRHVAAQLDWFSWYFHQHVSLGGINISTTNLVGEVGDKFDMLDKASGCEPCGYGDITSNGATYFLQRMFDQGTVRADYAKLMGIVVNSDHERYPDGEYCTTSGCEDHTMGVLNESPMSEWEAEFPGFPLVAMLAPVDYTREQVMTFLWLPTLFTVFVAMLVACFNFKVHAPKMRRCCTAVMMTCTVCQLFFALLLTMLLFPLVLVFQDVCASGANIGNTYIVAYGDDMCENMFGGTGTLRDCQLVSSTGSTNVTFSVDILAMYDGFFKQKCGANDPFKSIFYDVALQITEIPTEELNKTLDDMSDFNLRPALKNVFIEATDNSGQLIGNLFTDTADNSINCQNLGAIMGGIQGATCDSFVAPSLWIIGTWYLCAWMLLCCMFPAGCCRKNYNMVQPAAEEGEGEREELVVDVESPDARERDFEGQLGKGDGYSAPYEQGYEGGLDGDLELPQVSGDKAKEFESSPNRGMFSFGGKKSHDSTIHSGGDMHAVVVTPHYPTGGRLFNDEGDQEEML